MSAYVVPPDHLRLMVEAATSGRAGHSNYLRFTRPSTGWSVKLSEHAANVRQDVNDPAELTPDEALELLHAENLRSVAYRYSEEEAAFLAGNSPTAPKYRGPRAYPHGKPPAVLVLKAIDCYEYQACEHPDWERSDAAAFCHALRGKTIRELPGYDEAPGWSYTRAALEAQDAEKRAAIRKKLAS